MSDDHAPLETGGALTTERQIEALRRVSGAIAESADLPSLMATALEEVCDLLGLHSGWVYLLDEETEEPTLLTSQQLPPVSIATSKARKRCRPRMVPPAPPPISPATAGIGTQKSSSGPAAI
jgi:GAF domain-containing protein